MNITSSKNRQLLCMKCNPSTSSARQQNINNTA
jgi:hypothetical protein